MGAPPGAAPSSAQAPVDDGGSARRSAELRPQAPVVDINPALEAALVPRRSNTHPMAYAFIAAAAVFGGVAACVFTQAAPADNRRGASAFGDRGTQRGAHGGRRRQGRGRGRRSFDGSGTTVRPGLGKPWPKASATARESTPLDTSGIVTNVPGPVATPPPQTGGGQLSQGEISGVVAANQGRIRRRCWQPALDGQSANGPKSARVKVAITINASGNVDSASASGADSFPGLASCIGGMVRGWKFPPSGGSTPVKVPFVFSSQ